MNERLIREAEIAALRSKAKGIELEALHLITDVRQEINPASIKSIDIINIEEAEILFNSLKNKILDIRQIKKDIEFKERL